MASDSPDEDLTVGTASNHFIWNPSDKDMTTGKASNVLIWMFSGPNELGCSFPNSRSIFITHLPTTVNEEGNLTFLKNGYYQTAGKCINCGDLGPCHSHCICCNPLGFLYLGKEIELDRFEIINDDPRSEGRMAHIVHSDILNQPNPVATREQFLFLRQLRMDDPTFWDDKTPITSMVVPEKAMGKLKMRIAARLMHSTILCQPDPEKSQTHFASFVG
jgi:hypothetical protein